MMTSFKRITYLLTALFILGCSFSFYAEAQRVKGKRGRTPSSLSVSDSIQGDSLLVDSLALDTVGSDTAKKKDPLDAPVVYEASDSIVFTRGGFAHLYGNGKVNYQNIELTSAVITMNMDSSTVFARGVEESTGVATGTPVCKDGETPYESDIMRYNFPKKRGLINSISTQRG